MRRGRKGQGGGSADDGKAISLNAAMAEVDLAEREALLAMWPQHYDVPPPKGISVKMLKLAMSYQLQVKAWGGLRPATRRHLHQVVRNAAEVSQPPRLAEPGTRLIRQWHGQTYEAVIETDRVVVNGRAYASLTEAACAITGVKWSGPRFFGLIKVKAAAI